MARTPTQAPGVPTIVQGLLGFNAPQPTMPPSQGLASGMTSQQAPQGASFGPLPSYQIGGAIGPDGMPLRPAGAQPGMQPGLQPGAQRPAGPMSPDAVEAQIQDFATKNPQAVAQIKQAVDEAIASGELTPEELNMMTQMATTVLRNPALYPQIRAFAIQQGLATEQDLSPQYDEGLVIAILIAARSAQGGGQPSFKMGGKIGGSGDSKPVSIEAHTGEYVIPKHVVDMKGREFFDQLLEKYADHAE